MSVNPFTDEFFMKEAIKEAFSALEKDEVPVGCVIVCKNQIISRSHNFVETLKDVTAHAEMQAITSASSFFPPKTISLPLPAILVAMVTIPGLPALAITSASFS